MKVLIATTNAGKIAIYKEILKEAQIECVGLNDIGCKLDVEETGKTEVENALIKALAYYKATDMPVISNDSGLIIEKLKPEEQPGVFVRRHNGKELTDEELLNVYIEKISAVGGSSNGHFNVGLAIVDQHGQMHTREFCPKRFFINKASKIIKKGIPLDSIAFDEKTGKFMSEMTIVERNNYEADELAKQKDFILEVFESQISS
ncbi:MAG: non-canonical purine NTP pyrophosphatase [Clostridia bacterium]